MEAFSFNEYKPLPELDPNTWLDFNPDDAEMAALWKRLAAKQVRRLDTGDLHALLRRGLSLPICVPLAMEKLEDDPFLQAATHPGDLLVAALETNPAFWAGNKPLWLDMMLLLGEAAARVEQAREQQELSDYYPEFVGEDFMAALLHFRGLHESGSG